VREPFLQRVATYEELWSQIDFAALSMPERFNLGVACLDDQDRDAVALVEVDRDGSCRSYTFGDVCYRANRLANALAGLGVRRGDVVAVVNPASLETAVALMAAFRMGAIALPVSSLFGPDALRYRLSNGEARAVITSEANAPKVREALRGCAGTAVVVVGGDAGVGEHDFAGVVAAASPEFVPCDTGAEDPCLMIYTSGTTGDPKGALHAHRVGFGHITAFETMFDFFPQPNDVIWSPADWAWIAGVMDILVPAWWFGVPVVVDRDTVFKPERAVWLMREHQVTLTVLPPTALRMIRATGLSGDGLSMRAVCSGGEELGADLLGWSTEFFGGAVVNEGYGQTELNAVIGNCASVFAVKPGSLGRALPGTTVAVLDLDGDPVVNVTGEIAIDRRHPNAMLEYWRNPRATAEKFDGDWLLTGDLGVMDDDGYVWFVSRKDDVISSSGYRIGPGEIESSLGGHPSVAMAAVIGVPDERKGEVPKAFVVLRPGVEASDALAEELRQHVRVRLAAHEVPREVVFRDALPQTSTGKILRRALRDT
jgi:acetyl-CoA synthetase